MNTTGRLSLTKIFFVLLLLAGGLFGRLVIDSSKQDSMGDLNKTAESPTPIFTSSPLPAPTKKPVAIDPIIKCGPSKSGTTIEMKRSECKKMIDCQLGSNWVIMKEDECRRTQAANRSALTDPSMTNCQTKTGWIVMKKEDCIKLQADWSAQIQGNIEGNVKAQLHEQALREYEQELIQQGLTREAIDAELYKLDQTLKAQGL